MLRIDIHNEKGGVGCTTIANHLIRGAREIGLRVAAMSLDPTQSLVRELEGTGTPIVEPGADLDDAVDLLIIDRNTQHHGPIDADVRVIPIRDRRSLELACELSDRYPAPILWVRSMTNRVPAIPGYLKGRVRLTSAIPLSDAIAMAAWRRRIVWDDDDLAATAGARSMRRAVFDILRRAMGTEVVLDPPSTALPIEPGDSVLLRHAPA